MSYRHYVSASVVILCTLLLGSASWAASSLVFPRLSFEAGTFTGLAIANLSTEAAEVTMTAYGADGEVLSGGSFQNPVTLTIGANQQLARLITEVFSGSPPAGEVAWVHLTSPNDGITGFFLFLNSSVTQFDGADLPSPATQIIFNLVRSGDGLSTEINLINTGAADSQVDLQVIQNGNPLAEQTLTMSGRSVLRFDAAQQFNLSEIPSGSFLRVGSTGLIAGFEFLRTRGGDLLGLNARDSTDRQESLYFPQLVVLGPWKSELGIINYSDEPVLVTVWARKPDGNPYGADSLTTNPVTYGLEGASSRVDDLEELFGFQGDSALDGWIEVRSSAEAINGFVSYGIPSLGSLAGIAVSNRTNASVFSHIATAADFFTGIALLNPASLTTDVKVLALRPSGEILGRSDVVLRPGQRISRLITELIPAAADQSNGLVWVESVLPIYSSSLFGSTNVLANVPPQQSPESFEPDIGPSVNLSPPLAVVQPGGSQQFQAQGISGPFSWEVDEIPGGSAEVGTIDSQGLYTAPASAPDPALVSISASSGDVQGGASIDILRPEVLLQGLGTLQSLVYLASLQQLYEVELVSLSSFGRVVQAQTSNRSELFQVLPPAVKTFVADFDDNIIKLISYLASDGLEYVLVLGQDSGGLIRLDPISRGSRLVFSGLNSPTSMVFDSVTGNVLIAEADRISSVSPSFLETGLSPSAASFPPGRDAGTDRLTVSEVSGASGIAIDQCTGEIYFSVADEGALYALDRDTGARRLITDLLSNPTQILSLYRRDVPCPEQTQLLIAEPGQGRIALVSPATGLVIEWIPAPGIRDLVLLPQGNPFNGVLSIAYGIFLGALGEVRIVEINDQYGRPPTIRRRTACESPITFDDPNLERVVRQSVGLTSDEPISCEAVEAIIGLDAPIEQIRSLQGIEFLVNLHSLDISRNLVNSLAPATALRQLRSLHATFNLIQSADLIANLSQLTTLDLSHNVINTVLSFSGIQSSLKATPGVVSFQSSALSQLTSLNLAFNNIGDISGLSDLVNLQHLDLGSNSIRSLAPLQNLTSLQDLRAGNNLIDDLEGVENLVNLSFLDLRNNRIGDLTPLLQNPGLGPGDVILLAGNPLGAGACSVVDALRARGIEIDLDIECNVDLSLNLGLSSQSLTFGDIVLLRASVSNVGQAPASNVVFTSRLPSGTIVLAASAINGDCTVEGQKVTCNWDSLDIGGTGRVAIRLEIRESTGQLTFSGQVVSDEGDVDPVNNSDGLTVPLSRVDLVLSKRDSQDPVNSGDNLTYSITVNNQGPTDARRVVISDELPSGLAFVSATLPGGTCSFSNGRVECRVASITSGSSVVLTVSTTVTQTSGTLNNTASVTSAESDTNPTNNVDTESTAIALADLAIAKTASSDPVDTDGSLIYSVTVTNNGPDTATGIALSDLLPPGVSVNSFDMPGASCSLANAQIDCALPTLGSGAAAVLTIDVTVTATGGTLTNTASVSAAENDPNPSNNTDSVNTRVTQADLSLAKSAVPDPAVTGSTLDYDLIVTNRGPDAATTTTLIDTLPPGTVFLPGTSSPSCSLIAAAVVQCDLGSIPSGGFAQVTIAVTVQSTAGSITNTASVSADQADPQPTDNFAVLNTSVVQRADLAVTQSASPVPVRRDADVTYSVIVTNNGPSPATGVTLLDTIPSSNFISATAVTGGSCGPPSNGVVTCDLGSLPAGGFAQVDIVVNYDSEGDLLNTATATANEVDPNPADNTSVLDPPLAQADLSLTASDNPDPVLFGNTTVISIVLSNLGPDSATNTSLFLSNFDATMVSATPSQGTCEPLPPDTPTSFLSCDLGTIGQGGNVSVDIEILPDVTDQTITSSISAFSDELDPNPTNDPITEQTTVFSPPIG